MTSLLKEFRQFVLRGNLVDLAVAMRVPERHLAATRCAFCTSEVGPPLNGA